MARRCSKMGRGRAVGLLLLLSVLWVSCRAAADPEEGGAGAVEMFERWMERHRKVYAHPEEKARRYGNFLRNLEFVRRRNAARAAAAAAAGSPGHAVGLNVFADLSNEEFKEMYSSRALRTAIQERRSRKRLAEEVAGRAASCEAPASLDWRNRGAVTAVKDQGQCGSCWAFSSTGAIEGINAITSGDLVSLSEQELVDCDATNDGCQGGYMDYAFEWVINNGGIDSEANYPYTGVDSTCNTTKEEEKVVSIDGYEDVAANGEALLCAVVQQPVSVGIDGSSLDFQLYTGGIYAGDCSDNPDDIDHAVLIVGYGEQGGEDYWIVKNSWGTSWGINGYIYIKRNTGLPYGVCAIDAMASYPTKHSGSASPPSPAVEPPPPPPPPPPASPSPSQCGDYSYCPADETCCCILDLGSYCLIYGCCSYQNAVCCTGTSYCCPQDYPICDVPDGLCLQNAGDVVGVAAKRRTLAKPRFPWTRTGGAAGRYRPLLWKGDGFAAQR